MPEFSTLHAFIASGGVPGPRVTTGAPAIEHGRFLHGIMCAKASKTGTIGFVASLPKSNGLISRGVNGFIVGAKLVNSNINIAVAISGAFLDVVAETVATEELIKKHNADCIAVAQNDLTPNTVASESNVYSVGYVTDTRYFTGGEYVLSSLLFKWENMIIPVMEQYLTDSWIPNYSLTGGLDMDVAVLSDPSTLAQASWMEDFQTYERYLRNSSDPHQVFCTPHFTDPQYMTENNTYEASPEHTCLNAKGIRTMLGVINAPGVSIAVEFNSTHTPYVRVWIPWKSAAAIAAVVLCSILIIAALAVSVDVIANNRRSTYRAASPQFCLLILSGVVIASVAPFFWIGEPTKYSCMARWWLMGIGYSLIFSCILAKNWRIWRIFKEGNLKVFAILNSELILQFVAVIVGLNILLLILWTVFDPQIPLGSTSINLKVNEIQVLCASKSGKSIGLTIFLVFHGCMLIPAAFISYITRSARGEYRESQAIFIVVYASILLFLVFVGVSVAIPKSYTVGFYMGAYGMWALIFVAFVPIFLPKLYTVHIAGTTQTGSSYSTDNRGSRTNTAPSTWSSKNNSKDNAGSAPTTAQPRRHNYSRESRTASKP